MSISSDTSRENLTLSESDLAACHPIVAEGGHVLRALVSLPWLRPPAQPARAGAQRPLRLLCLWRLGLYGQRRERVAGGAAAPGGLPEASGPPAAGAQRATPPASGSSAASQRHAHQHRVSPPQHGPTWRSSSPRSRPPCRAAAGAAYLQQRGIPLALAQQCGVGYAAPGTWPHPARDWRGGRVVFPHTTPDGRLVNLYGRAVGTAEQVPEGEAARSSAWREGVFQRRRAAGRCRAAVGVRGCL